ncbi:hypothetical protein FSARC_7735 [Fusarium sarcochroum]|uniref:GTP-binding protein n=1 Tax=Fusarium sarcochroum TaxID=1208366 RepID=A0A8H4TUS6_9HYPO|nr:hypothetical protein FSARC_7735 [Fusarium sarcochroum]
MGVERKEGPDSYATARNSKEFVGSNGSCPSKVVALSDMPRSRLTAVSKSPEDAHSHHKILLGKMDDVIQQNEALAQRLEKLEGAIISDNRSVKFLDDASSTVSRRLSSISFKRSSISSLSSLTSFTQKRASIAISNPSIVTKSEFEEELEQSRVYTRTQANESDISFTSSNAPSNAWSMLSGMSLNDISVISAFRLPITVNDIDLLAPGSTFSILLTEQLATSTSNSAAGKPNLSRPRQSTMYAPQRVPQQVREQNKASTRLLASALTSYQVKGTIKVMVIGDRDAMKSNLIQTYAYGKGMYTPKSFDNFIVEVKVGNQMIRLALHDTTGQEKYEGLRLSTYHGTKVFIILSKQSSIEGYVNVEEKWVPEIAQCCPETPYLLVATHRKQPATDNLVPENSAFGHQVARRLRARAYTECDVEDPVEARAVFNRAIAVALGLDQPSGGLRAALRRGALKPLIDAEPS